MTDRDAIHAVLVTYVNAIDKRDRGQVAACFAGSATARYSGTDIGPGADVIAGVLFDRMASVASTHLLGNVAIALTGPTTATAESTVVVTHVYADGERPRLVTRGLRYVDEFVLDGHWAIQRRMHAVIWSTSSTGDPL